MNIGLIGLGYWGKIILKTLINNKMTDNIYVSDIDIGIARAISKNYENIKINIPPSHLLANPEIDAVIIATPAENHFQLALEGLRFNKHLFIEKPFTKTITDANLLLNIAEEKKLKICVDHTLIYSNHINYIKSLIDNNDLGKINYITTTRRNLGPYRPDTEVIWDLAVHDMSILLYLLNEMPIKIESNGLSFTNGKVKDVGFLYMEFPNNICSNSIVSWTSPKKDREITIVGTKAMLICNELDAFEPIKIYDKGIDIKESESYTEFKYSLRNGEARIPNISFNEPLKDALQNFLNSITSNEKIISDGIFGKKIIEMLVQCK